MTVITDAGGLVVSSSDVPLDNYDVTGETVRQAPEAAPDPTGAPPKADAAVRASAGETFAGLVTLLNNQQQAFVREGLQDFADEYEIVFVPESIKNSSLAKAGTTSYNNTALKNTNDTGSYDPSKDSTNMKSRTWSIAGGASIIQVINDIVKSSSFITDQMLKTVDEQTQTTIANDVSTAKKNVTWFEIIPVATPTDNFDKKRNDFAYKITYYINKYEINRMVSDYFPEANYRGAHKSYNYWYTGENSAILDLSIEYNALYQIVAVDDRTDVNQPAGKGLREQQIAKTKQVYGDLPFQPTVTVQATTASSAQGAKGKTNEGPASAEDFLFEPTALSQVTMTIVGDPAWLIQGPQVTSNQPPDAAPFLPDGTINFNGQQVNFVLAWNAPADYNLETGLMEIVQTQKNPDGTAKNLPQVALAYYAGEVESTFKGGKFEQQVKGYLMGSLKQLQTPSANNNNGREQSGAADNVREPLETSRISDLVTEPPEQTDPPQALTNGDNGSAEIPNVLPSAIPQPPTSDGIILDETGRISNFRRNTESGELFDATGLNTARNEETGEYYEVTGLNTKPQLMNREF